MNKLVVIAMTPVLTIIKGCGSPPTTQSLVGTYIGPDGGRLIINGDNTFSAVNLPFKVFDNPIQAGGPISGKGLWKLKGERFSGWEVWMHLSEVAGKPARREIRIMISENKSSLILYQWMDQEGGARYEMIKK